MNALPTKREQEIIDILYQLGEGTVQDVLDRINYDTSYNSVRVSMYLLESKGYLTHRKLGVRHLYKPKIEKSEEAQNYLENGLKIFFDGSVTNLVSALLGSDKKKLTDEEINKLHEMIEKKMKNKNG